LIAQAKQGKALRREWWALTKVSPPLMNFVAHDVIVADGGPRGLPRPET
jgi:hypothetical protein